MILILYHKSSGITYLGFIFSFMEIMLRIFMQEKGREK